MPRQDPREPADSLPPLLQRMVQAAEHAAIHDQAGTRRGHAGALAALGQLARLSVPARGALMPHDDELYAAIEAVAERHLELKEAHAALHDALGRLANAAERSAIEEAHLWLRSQSDTAYFYAGLAFGITLADLGAR